MYQAKGLHGFTKTIMYQKHRVNNMIRDDYVHHMHRIYVGQRYKKSHHRDGYFTSTCRRATRKLYQQIKNYHAR